VHGELAAPAPEVQESETRLEPRQIQRASQPGPEALASALHEVSVVRTGETDDDLFGVLGGRYRLGARLRH
jgi:hypothetical protein